MSYGEMAVALGVALLVAGLMEPWSRFVHGRVWHGVLYRIHRTHHPDTPPSRGGLELNDVFSFVHALPAGLAFVLGLAWLDGLASAVAIGVAAGLSLYGVAYAVVHDGLVHGRLPMRGLLRFRALRRIRAAHEVHHRDGGPPYGLFLGPSELKRARATPLSAPDRWRVDGGARHPARRAAPET